MGVRGLKSFISNNDDLLIKDYKLHDTVIVIDACNLQSELMAQSQGYERADLFGGNMVQYGRYLYDFFDNLSKCNVTPILVFDGGQTRETNKCKTREQYRRAMEAFQSVMSIKNMGFGDFTLPVTVTNVFRSVVTDLGLNIVQCMYEADLEVARMANEYKCPAISNDSDFYLIDLSYGVIPIDRMRHRRVLKHFDRDESSPCYHYISCDLFTRTNFVRYFPDLNVECLPLLGVMAGNDFIDTNVFDRICSQLPMQSIRSHLGLGSKNFKKTFSKQHEKILKILYYLCHKSLNQNINQICLKLPKENRQNFKKMIKSNLTVYDIPEKYDFYDELDKLYKPGFLATHSDIHDKEELNLQFRSTLNSVSRWLKRAMEHSLLNYKCLELAHRNNVFLRAYMDDSNLPSAHICHIRILEVMLALLKSCNSDSNKYCVIYDRLNDNSYGKFRIYPRKGLEKHGRLDYLLYDVPKLPVNSRMEILLGTFHFTPLQFSSNVEEYYNWFDQGNAEEFLTMKYLFKFIDIENPRAKMWAQFKRAVLISILYYRIELNNDVHSRVIFADSEFYRTLVDAIQRYKLTSTPRLSKGRLYNCRLMHQITQLQNSITSFNLLNALLGDIMTRIRPEFWLNSCLLYNLTENLRQRRLPLEDELPSIIRVF